MSTPPREGSKPSSSSGGGGNGGASSLQAYLSSVGDTLTPDGDSSDSDDEPDCGALTDSGSGSPKTAEAEAAAAFAAAPPAPSEADLIGAVRAELQSTRELQAAAAAALQSRQQRDADRCAAILGTATAILGASRSLQEVNKVEEPEPGVSTATQTEQCEGLAPLHLQRVEDDADMMTMMCLTAQVAAVIARKESALAAEARAAATGATAARQPPVSAVDAMSLDG